MRVIISVFLLLSFAVQADIYKKVDNNGRITYSSTPIKGGERISGEPKKAPPAPAAKKPAVTPVGSTEKGTLPSPVAQGSVVDTMVDPSTQKARDTQRGRILQAELNRELAAQESTRKQLADARTRTDQAEIRRFEEEAQIHTNNIQALQAEIRRIK